MNRFHHYFFFIVSNIKTRMPTLHDFASVATSSALVLLICILSKAKSDCSGQLHSASRALVDQCLKWTRESSDRASIGGFRNAVYASAYVAAARSLTNDYELSRATGVDVHELAARIDERHTAMTKKLAKELRLRRSAVATRDSWIAT